MKFAKTLSILGLLAMLAACAVAPPDNSLAYRPGAGVVEAVQPARVALPAPGSGTIAGSEAAGSHDTPLDRLSRPRWTDGYQLTLRMDDGSSQRVTQDSAAFQVGDRVQITSEGRVVKTAAAITPAPSAAATPAPTAYRPGVGTVESASVASLSSAPSASAGATAGAASNPTMAYRVRMADGTMQDV